MNFENPTFLILAIGGLSFVIVGYIMLRFPPKNINPIYGYRTTNSMKSQERWDFAQKYSTKELIKAGIAHILIAILFTFIEIDELTGVLISLGLMLVIIVRMFLKVENALKQKFKDE